ncbi:reverse transcriptase [Senna tora]|uniref:Reverse transcriptase n=1 Tax=Senna tora TaxID=362788 RepID=A0A834WDC7_9FABA|nr:reverse transcriptase [Senna tora]
MKSRLQANLAGRKMRDLLEETSRKDGEAETNHKNGDEEINNQVTDHQANGADKNRPASEPGNQYKSWADEVEAQELETEKTKEITLKDQNHLPDQTEGKSNAKEIDRNKKQKICFGSIEQIPQGINKIRLPNSPTPSQNAKFPAIQLSTEEIRHAHDYWASSIIVRLIGCWIDQPTLSNKLFFTWKLKTEPILLNIGSGFFIVRFGCVEDRWKALLHGPTFINGHFLALNFWKDGFSASSVITFSNSLVWIKLEGLPIELFDPNILVRIGNAIGSFIGIDGNTHTMAVAKHAKICVLLDLSEEIPSHISIGNFLQPVTIEGISSICLTCGGANHAQLTCKGKKPLLPTPQPPFDDAGKDNQWQVVSRRKKSITAKGKEREQNSNLNQAQRDKPENPEKQRKNPLIVASKSKNDKISRAANKEQILACLPKSRDSSLLFKKTPTKDTSSPYKTPKSNHTQPLNQKNKMEKDISYTKDPIESLSSQSPKFSPKGDNPSFSKPPSHSGIATDRKSIIGSETTPNLVLNIEQIRKSLQPDTPSSFQPPCQIQVNPADYPLCPSPILNLESSINTTMKATLVIRNDISSETYKENPSFSSNQDAETTPLIITSQSHRSNAAKQEPEAAYGAEAKTQICQTLQDPNNHSSEGFLSEESNGDTTKSHQPPEPQHKNPIPLENMGKPHISSHSPNNLATSMGSPTVGESDSSDQRARSERTNDEPPGQRTSTPDSSSYHSDQPCPDRPSDEQRAVQHQPAPQVQAVDASVTCSLSLDTGYLDYHLKFSPIPSLKPTGKFYMDDSPNEESYIEPELEESVGSVGQHEVEIDNNMTLINILAWNARGAASADFQRAIMDLKNRHLPRVVFISETRVGGIRAENIIKSIGYDGFYKVDPMGYAGGLWLMWNSSFVKMDIHGESFQEIQATMEVSNFRFLVSFVYASPIRDRRKVLWSNLMNLAEIHSMPWLICGDFNDVLSLDEKWGGLPASSSRIREFKHCIDYCGVTDLGFLGQKFTWINKRDNGQTVFERLDRFLANPQWIHLFPHASNQHLPRIKPDHTPILLSTNPFPPLLGQKPFRCERIWLGRKDFSDLVRDCWSISPNINEGLSLIQDKAKTWNKNIFGNVFYRKNRLMRRLNGINLALQKGQKLRLSRLEQVLAKESQEVLRIEEELWASKSRIDWLQLGDSNTSFFHSSVVERRRSNRILALQDRSGNWLYNPLDIKDHITDYFFNCFNSSPVDSIDANLALPSVSSLENMSLSALPNALEIKNALFSLKPYKAPGVDGFQAAFFQKFWDIFEKDIIPNIQEIFSTKVIPPSWNETIICLIPKTHNPNEIKNFRPISLCNSLYKIISKILVNRIKPILPNLICENQAAFIRGRRATDNVILANEVIHSYNRKKSRKFGWMMISLDLEKAYDKLNWSFISSILTNMNFPPETTSLIHACISSVSHQILINGTLSNFIQPSRGIRQGDPLSPFIFICCMQYLSSLIDVQVRNKSWSAPKLRNTPISHLLFADDVLLFARVDSNSISAIKNVINSFVSCSGLSINNSKSSIWFSNNTPQNMRNTASRDLNFAVVDKPGNYLGSVLGFKGKHSDFIPLLNKVQIRIDNWSNRFLSLAGKTTLINSVISPIITFHTNSTILPSKTSKAIDKTIRDFFWSSAKNKQKIHTIAWDKVCMPTSLGGLGIHLTKERNLSLITKLSWQVKSNHNSMWSKAITHYLNPSCNSYSTTGRAIKKGSSLISSNSISSICNGKNTNVWYDRWLNKDSLRSLIVGPLQKDENLINVNFFANEFGSWSWDFISFDLPPAIKDLISAIPCFKDSPNDDVLSCTFLKDGYFNLNLIYNDLISNKLINVMVLNPYKWIWKLNCHRRLKFFLWMCVNNGLPTKVILSKRRVPISVSCSFCNLEDESSSHIFRDCPLVQNIWSLSNSKVSIQISDPFEAWIKDNCLNSNLATLNTPHNILFIYTLWHIWLARNEYIFKNKMPSPFLIAKKSNASAVEFFHVATENLSPPLGQPYILNVKWHPPNVGWWKLNCDGACSGNLGPFAIGGLIRDNLGNWVKGFSGFVGQGTALKAELWAIFSGTKLAFDLGCKFLWIETDSLLACKLLLDSALTNLHEHWNLISSCRSILQKFSEFKVSHTFREGNQCADLLAKLSLLKHEDYFVFQTLPPFLKMCFLADLHDVTFDRITSSSNPSRASSPLYCLGEAFFLI